jgi:hypothetical protein
MATLATNNGFGRSTVPNWDRTDHGNATKHCDQTELERMHDSVAVVCRIVKSLNAEDGMGTYKRILCSRAEKRKPGRASTVNLTLLI